MAAATIAVLDIELIGVAPPVRRRLAVPYSIRLDRLHRVLQAAMGWSNSHLWEIRAGGVGWAMLDPDGSDSLDAAKATLRSVVGDTGVRRLRYLYDFGDGWDHVVKLLRLEERVPGIDYPWLFDAQGRCPPEDVGGPEGYAELLAARRAPDDPRYAALRERFSIDFDPSDPNIVRLGYDVARLARKSQRPAPRLRT